MRFPVKDAYVASFLGGVFSGITSSSCVGPFSGVAIAGAFLYGNIIQSISIFLALGIGLSSPFLLISIFPQFVKKVPKPGEWLLTFKGVMGFAMLLSCTWPIWILLSQIPKDNVIVVMLCIILVAMFTWLLKHSHAPKYVKAIARGGFLASALIGLYNSSNLANDNQKTILWENYSEDILIEAKSKKEAIFLDFTASWCINCQFNERLFNDAEIVELFRDKQVQAIKCDWTDKSKEVSKLMKRYGAAAVPLYIYYPGNGAPYTVLPTILTKNILKETLSG
jgi:thiol:disulfide interchange protein DsbD